VIETAVSFVYLSEANEAAMPKNLQLIALREKTDRQLLTLAGHRLDQALSQAESEPISAQQLFREARELLSLVEATTTGKRARLEARAAHIASVLEEHRPLPARAACF
jgi:hypothetical protein